MNAGKTKTWVVCLAVAVLGCALVWKIAPLVSRSGSTRTAPAGANVILGPQAPPDSVLVSVSMTGFEPASITAKAGQPLKLAFFRPNAANCVREVVFPGLGIRKELPPGQTVVVDIPPAKSGPLGFECGMSMLKGRVIVR